MAFFAQAAVPGGALPGAYSYKVNSESNPVCPVRSIFDKCL